MGLSQRRVDETAWTHEQQHRGTAATPLATAILNLRHGQGAVARRLRFSHGAVVNVITDADRGFYTCLGETLGINDRGLVIPRLRGRSTQNFAFL